MMPRRRTCKKRSNKKKTCFPVKQPELQETEKQSDHETSNLVDNEHTVLEVSFDTISPTQFYGTQSSATKRHAETQGEICLEQSSSKKQSKLTNQLPKKDAQQINVNVETTTQADDETLLNVIESADLDQAFQLLKGNNHFSQDGLDRALISACRHGLKFLIQELVCLGANVQFKDPLGNTPLLICAESGFIDIVRFLLDMKADVNVSNSAGDTALILSIRPAGSLEMVRVLLDQNGIDFSHQNRDGYTALMKAVEVRDVDVIKILMDRYKKKNNGTSSRQVGKLRCRKPIDAVNCKCMTAKELAYTCGLGKIYTILKAHTNSGISLLDTAIKINDTRSLNILLNCQFVGKQDIQESFMNIFKHVDLKEGKTFTEKEMLIINRLLERGAEVDAAWSGGPTPLSVAVKMGDYDLVVLLCQHLDQRQKPMSQCYSEALIAAAKSGRCDLINLLLKYKADINHNYYPGSPLDCALSHGHLESAKLLVQHGAKIDIESAFQSAVTQQLPEYMNFVCENYQQEVISYAITFSYDLNKLLVSASKGENLEIIGHLLDAGADVNYELSGETPLGESKDRDVARFLISRGAKVNSDNDNAEPPLLKIINKKHVSGSLDIEVVKILLENGASVNESGKEGRTLLMVAASRKENVSLLQTLLDHGSDINSRDQRGNTALMEAVCGCCPLNVSFLLEFYKEKNIDIDVQNHDGETVLMCAMTSVNLKIAKKLIDFGADVNIKDEKGNTPLLHGLTTRNEPGEILTTLIKAGSDVNCQNKEGFSPLMLATKNYLKGAIITLLELGADVNAVSEKDSTKSALSFLINYSENNFRSCLETFLTKGAHTCFMKRDLLHRLILAGKIEFIPELIQRGLGPADVESNNVLFNTTSEDIPTVSPLFMALFVGNVSLARYIVGNLFLTNSDITSLTGNKILRHILERRQLQDCLNFLEELSSQPLSLFQLAFVTVSSAVGSSPGRENRVNMLPLPQVMKDKLDFKTQEVQLNVCPTGINYFLLDQQNSDLFYADFYTDTEDSIDSDDIYNYHEHYNSDFLESDSDSEL